MDTFGRGGLAQVYSSAHHPAGGAVSRQQLEALLAYIDERIAYETQRNHGNELSGRLRCDRLRRELLDLFAPPSSLPPQVTE